MELIADAQLLPSIHLPPKPTQVQISLVTSLPDPEKVSDIPITVPTDLKRKGLSELVNSLLGSETIVPYDFLIGGTLVRTSLGEYLEQMRISAEEIVTIEYVRLSPKPDEQSSVPHPDWVSALCSHESVVLSGCYDGVLRLWDFSSGEQRLLSHGLGHSKPIKSVAIFPSSASKTYAVSASMDASVKVWEMPHGEGEARCILNGSGASKQCIESVDVLPEETSSSLKFVSGGWDGYLMLWSSSLDLESSSKKLKSNAGSAVECIAEISPVARLSGHGGKVSAVCWAHALAIVSTGWDDSLRHWDSMTGSIVRSWSCGGSEGLSLSCSSDLSTSLFASGHTDKQIRLWDSRLGSGSVSVLQGRLRSHRGWVTAVHWIGAHQLMSTGRDGTVKIWDVRASVPLHTLEIGAEGVVGLSLTRVGGAGVLLAGASDSEVHVYNK
jgi:ribosome biogenesis protein YTM1